MNLLFGLFYGAIIGFGVGYFVSWYIAIQNTPPTYTIYNFIDGKVSDIKLYKHALTLEEVENELALSRER